MSNDTLPVTAGLVYKGYTYAPDFHEEDDNCKIMHDVNYPNGKYAFHINHSPYSYPSIAVFKSLVDEFISL